MQEEVKESSTTMAEELDPKRSHFRRLMPLMVVLFLLTCAGPVTACVYMWYKGNLERPYSVKRSEAERRVAEQVAADLLGEAKTYAKEGNLNLALQSYRSILFRYPESKAAEKARAELAALEKKSE